MHKSPSAAPRPSPSTLHQLPMNVWTRIAILVYLLFSINISLSAFLRILHEYGYGVPISASPYEIVIIVMSWMLFVFIMFNLRPGEDIEREMRRRAFETPV